jgi:hypothetical protein
VTKQNHTRFVAPDPPAPRVEIIRSDLPPAPIVEPYPHASHTDRARAFTLATAPLAATTALVVLLIGLVAFGIPILSVAALLLALGGFGLVWAISFIVFTFVSPDGALVLHTIFLFGLLRREQKERIRRYGKH